MRKARSGVPVRVILDGARIEVNLADPGWIKANWDASAFLAQRGIAVRSLLHPAVHVKAIVVDGARAFLGSQNLSENSLSNNREIGLITLEEPVRATTTTTFAKDWAMAAP